MYALAFYFSFYTVNKKVEERLDAGEKDGWKIVEAVCRDPEIQDQTCGNRFALYAHDYKLSDYFWDSNKKAKLPKWGISIGVSFNGVISIGKTMTGKNPVLRNGT
mgnify:FL=1